MRINKIIKFSSVDGPGNRLVIFFQGCNFNCIFCHNPETIDFYSDGENLSYADVMDQIIKAKDFIGGVTLSGGECTLQHEDVYALAKMIKSYEIPVYADTNFSLDRNIYSRLNDVIDKYIVDLKAYDEQIHLRLTGSSNKNVIENIKVFSDRIYEVRIVVIPDYNATDKEMESIFKFILDIDSSIRIKLIKYREYGVREEFKDLKTPTDDEMENFVRIGLKLGLKNIYYK